MAERTTRCLQVRSAGPADAPALNQLFNQVFNIERDAASWRWKFIEQDGCDRSAWTAIAETANDEIVGQYPLMARRFQIDAQEVLAAQAVDTAVAARHRGALSTIKRLRFAATGRAAADGAAFAFGFPKPELERIGRYLLRYEPLATIRARELRLNVYGPLARRLPWLPRRWRRWLGTLLGGVLRWRRSLRHSTRRQSAQLLSITHFDERFDDLWRRSRGNHRVCGVRDQAFLRWRFSAKPHIRYEIFALASAPSALEAYIVLRHSATQAKTVDLMDFLATDHECFSTLLHRVLHICSRRGEDWVRAWTTPGPLDDVLVSAGFRHLPTSEAVAVVYSCLSPDLRVNDLADVDQWFLTCADFDTV